MICLLQVTQYNKLKEVAERQSPRYVQELDSVKREQKSDQDRLDSESRVRGEIENQRDARISNNENARRRKKQEVVENLKRLYRGVYDRIVNLCQPVHQRFNLAVTRLLGKYMDAIVVNTGETAAICIQFLKDQKLEPETFLPLDRLKVNLV